MVRGGKMNAKIESKQDLLRQAPLFAGLSKRSLSKIGKMADEVDIKAGAVLAKQGTRGYEFVLILEGEARVERDGVVVNRLSKNNFFGEIALLDGKPRVATVIAETDIRLLVVHSRFFKTLLNETPNLQKEIILALCRYLREARPSPMICTP